MNLVGRFGYFVTYDDVVWGEKYGGERAQVLSHERFDNEVDELLVQFDDGVKLTVGSDEFEVIK